MTSDEAVDALSYEQITKLLKEIVRSVDANGSPARVPDILNDWSLVAPFWDKSLAPSPVKLHVDTEASCVGETIEGVFEGRTITAKAIKDENALVYWQSTDLQYEGIVTRLEWEHWQAAKLSKLGRTPADHGKAVSGMLDRIEQWAEQGDGIPPEVHPSYHRIREQGN